MSKFSLAGVEIELEAAAKKLASGDIDEVKDVADNAAFADPSAQLGASLAQATPADYAVVYLGSGNQWLTSRLYFLACLATRMRKIRAVVFLASHKHGRRFVGLAPCDRLQWALAKHYPAYEIAFAHAYLSVVSMYNVQVHTVEPGNPPLDSDGKISDPQSFKKLLTAYKTELQFRGPQAPMSPQRGSATSGTPSGWAKLGVDFWERGEWINVDVLERILGQDLSRTAALTPFRRHRMTLQNL